MTYTNRVVLLSVLHPYSIESFSLFFRSIKEQTFTSFDVMLGDDGFIKMYGEKVFKKSVYDLDKKLFIFKLNHSPLLNRKYLLEIAVKKKYDIIVFADSDEYMDKRRIEEIYRFFLKHKDEKIVFNNSVWEEFNLYYKDKITFEDILDFNVLGFGAMSIRREMAEFVIGVMNDGVSVFDWYFSFIYLSKNRKVYFLKNAKNIYIKHSNHTVGPTVSLEEELIVKGVNAKKDVYSAFIKNHEKWGIPYEKVKIIEKKLSEVHKIENYIKLYGVKEYMKAIKDLLKGKKFFYWWEYIVYPKNISQL